MSEPTTVGPNQPNMAIFGRNLDHVLQQLGGEERRDTASVVRGCRQLSFEDVEQGGSARAGLGDPSSLAQAGWIDPGRRQAVRG